MLNETITICDITFDVEYSIEHEDDTSYVCAQSIFLDVDEEGEYNLIDILPEYLVNQIEESIEEGIENDFDD